MLDKKQEDLMIEFLKLNYPISRFKINGRFKRAILLDKRVYFLSDKLSNKQAKEDLINIIMMVFDCDSITATNVITKQLSI